jgi:hypothetical protein
MHPSRTVLLALFWVAAAACSGKGDDSATTDGADGADGEDGSSSGACTDTDHADLPACSAWWMNSTETAAILATDGTDALVHVQSVELTTVDGVDYLAVTSLGLPSYTFTFTQHDIDTLNGRPLAATDFLTGQTTATVGQTIDFGEDIGYDSSGCTRGETDEGAGFWPPGPECPEAQSTTMMLPVTVTPATETCWTGINSMGMLLNGVAIFNWSDGFSYNSESTWYNLAQKLEVYDLGVCRGHAAGGLYHQHLDAPCFEAQVGETGSGHSALYGFAADGVPLYGPYVASGQRAQSCWVTRDYDDPSDSLGCGGTGARDCLLVDPLDPTQGTTAASHDGPSTSGTVTSLSGNIFVAETGLFFEDYYFDADCATGGLAYMDEHNGHEHDDLGYHYHMTDSFPYIYGPTYYGSLDDNTLVSCSSSPYPSMGGGGMGGP